MKYGKTSKPSKTRICTSNSETDEIVINFHRGTLPKTTTKKVEQKYVGSPSQDTRLPGAGGGATIEDGKIIYETEKTDFSESMKISQEDIEGIVLDNPNYSKRHMEKQHI